jgi:sugar phosphate isomerase/epimerase
MVNRRQFIKTSAATAAGVLTAASVFPFQRSFVRTKHIGLQVWSVARYLQQDFKGTMDMIAKLGYEEIELFGPYPFSTQKDKDAFAGIGPALGFSQSGYFDHSVSEFKTILDGNGLKTPAMHVGLDTLRNKLGETAEAMHLLGQQYAGLAAIPENERQTLDDYKRIADEFNKIGEKAKSYGIRFYYHNHGYGLQKKDGVVPFDMILERTDPALVYLEMDLFWTVAGGADPIAYFDKNPGRYKLVHVKDMTKLVHFSSDGSTPQQWVELFPYITDAGTGAMDLKNILSHARKAGVEHFIIENDAVKDMKKSLEQGVTYLSKLPLAG